MENVLSKEYNWEWITATRESSRGRPAGGLVLGIRKEMNYKNVKGNPKGCWESAEIEVEGKWISVISIYNNSDLNHLKRDLEPMLEELVLQGKQVIMGGDLNARIGELGATEEGERRATKDKVKNKEGEGWASLLNTYELVLMNGNVEGDHEGEFTRLGYVHQEEAVLDYAAISGDLLEDLKQFKIGTENSSDHFPLEISLTRCTTTEAPTMITTQSWTEQEKQAFTHKLSVMMPAKEWKQIRDQLWMATAKKTRKANAARRSQWWTKECYAMRQSLRILLLDVRQGRGSIDDYRKVKRTYKQTIKEAKQRHDVTVRKELDQVVSVNDGWKFIKKYTSAKTQTTGKRPAIGSFTTHFCQLLQGEKENDGAPVSFQGRDSLTEEEFYKGVRSLKERKAAGPDQLKAESIIYAGDEHLSNMKNILSDIITGKTEIPEEWCESTIWPIWKKGDPTIPANYRGIAIGNAIYKLLATLVNERLKNYVEANNILSDTQSGFRKNRSTVDNIYVLDQCIRNATSISKGKLFTLFIDFKTAFDHVNRARLFTILEQQGIPHEIVSVVRAMYKTTTYLSEGTKFASYRGLKQGCPLSPLLFALYIAAMDQKLAQNQLGGIVLGGTKIFSLAYADDIVILAKDETALKDMIKVVHSFSKNRGLTINVEKSKVLVFSKGSRQSRCDWTIGGHTYEEVAHFQYLGVWFQRNGGFSKHHEETVAKANKRATQVWSLGERLFPNSYNVRVQMFETLVLPIITYAAETTGYSKCEEYEKTHRRYLKWTLGLPTGSRSAVIYCETGAHTVGSRRLMLAAKYENEMESRASKMVRAAWKDKKVRQADDVRRKCWESLGWSVEEANRRLGEDGFWRVAWNRTVEQHKQSMRAVADKVTWYIQPKRDKALYLLAPHFKTVSRFRCGAEAKGNNTWETDNSCRMCGGETETMQHVAVCRTKGRMGHWKELYSEDGRGIAEMKDILKEREARN